MYGFFRLQHNLWNITLQAVTNAGARYKIRKGPNG